MNRRTDSVTALIVEVVINLSMSCGLSKAARVLADSDVPIAVALRVLTQPHQRRVPASSRREYPKDERDQTGNFDAKQGYDS
jgi:hypothetical protein